MKSIIKASPVRTRRKFDEAFKVEAVRNWLASGKSAAVVGRELGLNENLLFAWRKLLAPADAGGRAAAGARRPGDTMSMTCTKCKEVMIQKVTADKAHVKMMTVGEMTKCHGCGGTSEVVATGKGEGKNAQVKHVCSKCGDDAMFCSAVKPGMGSMKEKEIDSR